MIIESRKVKTVIERMGFAEAHGDGSHTVYVNAQGHRIRPKFTNKDMHLRTLQSLRRQLDSLGLDGRRFWQEVRAA